MTTAFQVFFWLVGVAAAAVSPVILIDRQVGGAALGVVAISIVGILLCRIADSLDAIARQSGAVAPRVSPEIDEHGNERPLVAARGLR